MTREIKIKMTLEPEEQLTDEEIDTLKKSLTGQVIKSLNAEGLDSRVFGIIEHICHVHPVHAPPTTIA